MPSRWPSRHRPRWHAIAVFVLATSVVAALVQAVPSWTADSTLTVDAIAPPVTYEPGDGASNPRYFSNVTLSTNATWFSATLRARAGAWVEVTDVFRLVHNGSQARTVELTASQISNSRVERFDVRVRNGSTTVGILDHLEASPSVSFTMAPSEVFVLDVIIDLQDGAGRKNTVVTFDERLVLR